MSAASPRPTARTLVLLLTLVSSVAASAQTTACQRRIAAAAQLYEQLEYEGALEQLSKARANPRTRDDDVTIALYEGVILADMGKPADSAAAFRAGLLLKPDAVLPVKVSPKVQRDFERIRRDVASEAAASAKKGPVLQEDRPERPKPAAALEPSAVPADLQLNSGSSGATLKQAAPYAFVGAAVLAAAAGTYFGVQSRRHVTAARTSTQGAFAELDRANSDAKIANGFFIGAGLAAVAGAGAYWLWRDEPTREP
jgi:hypothetical protein